MMKSMIDITREANEVKITKSNASSIESPSKLDVTFIHKKVEADTEKNQRNREG